MFVCNFNNILILYLLNIILCPFKFKLLSTAKRNEKNRRYYLRKRGTQLLSRLEHQLVPYTKETNKKELQQNKRKSIEVDNEDSKNPSTPKKKPATQCHLKH